MSIERDKVARALSPPLPADIVKHLLDDYIEIKQHLAFRRFQPSELNGGRFAEGVVRLLQHLHHDTYIPFGTSLGNGAAETLRQQIGNNTELPDSLRYYIPRLAVVLMDIRNRRDVAHPGGDVSPNLSDSLFVAHTADWIMTEILRIYFQCPINEARQIASNLNEIRIPIIANVDGFLRVQNTALSDENKVLVMLYYKYPEKQRDSDMCKWIRHNHVTRFKKDVLGRLDNEALIHYEGGLCTLLDKGSLYVDKHIPMELVV